MPGVWWAAPQSERALDELLIGWQPHYPQGGSRGELCPAHCGHRAIAAHPAAVGIGVAQRP